MLLHSAYTYCIQYSIFLNDGKFARIFESIVFLRGHRFEETGYHGWFLCPDAYFRIRIGILTATISPE